MRIDSNEVLPPHPTEVDLKLTLNATKEAIHAARVIQKELRSEFRSGVQSLPILPEAEGGTQRIRRVQIRPR